MQNFVTQEDFELHWRLFDEMMNRFNLNANETAKAAGVSRVLLSRFRHGKADLGSTKLITLLLNLPHEPRSWYISQLFGSRPDTSLRSVINQSSSDEQLEALSLIAEALASKNRKNIDTAELAEAV
jgi:transcriptional regulator with XRE-family HTH domain